MKSKKTKTLPRFVVNGAIHFGARSFTCPALAKLEKTTVYVGYETFRDTEVDILDANWDVIATAVAVDTKAVA
ncbi:MAG: Mu transposase C-terminal domain-containing protein [Methylobacter sp.]